MILNLQFASLLKIISRINETQILQAKRSNICKLNYPSNEARWDIPRGVYEPVACCETFPKLALRFIPVIVHIRNLLKNFIILLLFLPGQIFKFLLYRTIFRINLKRTVIHFLSFFSFVQLHVNISHMLNNINIVRQKFQRLL